jgi:hypothetical protein
MPNLSLRADYSNNHFKGIGEIQQDITVDVYSAELRLAYTPRLQASLFYQYNSLDKQGRWNMRASWEFAPLSFLYIVFNESAYKDNPMRNQSIINKITYLKQF